MIEIDPAKLEIISYLAVLAVALVTLGCALFGGLALLGGDRGRMDEEATRKDLAKPRVNPYAHMRRVERKTKTVYVPIKRARE